MADVRSPRTNLDSFLEDALREVGEGRDSFEPPRSTGSPKHNSHDLIGPEDYDSEDTDKIIFEKPNRDTHVKHGPKVFSHSDHGVHPRIPEKSNFASPHIGPGMDGIEDLDRLRIHNYLHRSTKAMDPGTKGERISKPAQVPIEAKHANQPSSATDSKPDYSITLERTDSIGTRTKKFIERAARRRAEFRASQDAEQQQAHTFKPDRSFGGQRSKRLEELEKHLNQLKVEDRLMRYAREKQQNRLEQGIRSAHSEDEDMEECTFEPDLSLGGQRRRYRVLNGDVVKDSEPQYIRYREQQAAREIWRKTMKAREAEDEMAQAPGVPEINPTSRRISNAKALGKNVNVYDRLYEAAVRKEERLENLRKPPKVREASPQSSVKRGHHLYSEACKKEAKLTKMKADQDHSIQKRMTSSKTTNKSAIILRTASENRMVTLLSDARRRFGGWLGVDELAGLLVAVDIVGGKHSCESADKRTCQAVWNAITDGTKVLLDMRNSYMKLHPVLFRPRKPEPSERTPNSALGSTTELGRKEEYDRHVEEINRIWIEMSEQERAEGELLVRLRFPKKVELGDAIPFEFVAQFCLVTVWCLYFADTMNLNQSTTVTPTLVTYDVERLQSFLDRHFYLTNNMPLIPDLLEIATRLKQQAALQRPGLRGPAFRARPTETEKHLAEEEAKKLHKEKRAPSPRRVAAMHEFYHRAMDRRDQLRDKQMNEELKECHFQPMINRNTDSLAVRHYHREVLKPETRRDQLLREKWLKEEEEFSKHHTFQPSIDNGFYVRTKNITQADKEPNDNHTIENVNDTGFSCLTKSTVTSHQFAEPPTGYYESVARIREARLNKLQKQWRENRLGLPEKQFKRGVVVPFGIDNRQHELQAKRKQKAGPVAFHVEVQLGAKRGATLVVREQANLWKLAEGFVRTYGLRVEMTPRLHVTLCEQALAVCGEDGFMTKFPEDAQDITNIIEEEHGGLRSERQPDASPGLNSFDFPVHVQEHEARDKETIGRTASPDMEGRFLEHVAMMDRSQEVDAYTQFDMESEDDDENEMTRGPQSAAISKAKPAHSSRSGHLTAPLMLSGEGVQNHELTLAFVDAALQDSQYIYTLLDCTWTRLGPGGAADELYDRYGRLLLGEDDIGCFIECKARTVRKPRPGVKVADHAEQTSVQFLGLVGPIAAHVPHAIEASLKGHMSSEHVATPVTELSPRPTGINSMPWTPKTVAMLHGPVEGRTLLPRIHWEYGGAASEGEETVRLQPISGQEVRYIWYRAVLGKIHGTGSHRDLSEAIELALNDWKDRLCNGKQWSTVNEDIVRIWNVVPPRHVPVAASQGYTPTSDDIGYCLRMVITVVHPDGEHLNKEFHLLTDPVVSHQCAASAEYEPQLVDV
eukprot:Clim_evm29s141 gene=Clim_evmTU29s141